MFGFGEAKEHRDAIYGGEDHPEGSFTHEAIGAAAGFEAMHLWEKKQREEGKPVSHAFAKEALAAIASAEAEKLVETRLAPWANKEEVKFQAKRHAEKQAGELYDQQYAEKEEWHPDHSSRFDF